MRAHREPGESEAGIRTERRPPVRAPALRPLPTITALLALSLSLHASCTSDAPTFPSDTGGGAGASAAAGTGGSSGGGDAGAAGASGQGGGAGSGGAGQAGSAGAAGKGGTAGAGAGGASAGAAGTAGAPSCGQPQFASKADARVIPQQGNCDLQTPLKLQGKFGDGQVSQWFRAQIGADTKLGISCQTDAFVSAVVVSENVQVCASAKCGQGTEKQCPGPGCCGSNGIKATFSCVDSTVDGGGASQAADVFVEVRRMGTPTGCLDYILQVDTF